MLLVLLLFWLLIPPPSPAELSIVWLDTTHAELSWNVPVQETPEIPCVYRSPQGSRQAYRLACSYSGTIMLGPGDSAWAPLPGDFYFIGFQGQRLVSTTIPDPPRFTVDLPLVAT